MNVAVFCASSQPHDSSFAADARTLGHQLALQGHTLIYGGSNLGLMGEVSGAALDEGGHVVAVIPTLFGESIIESQPVSEIMRVHTMAERKERIIAMSDAFIALPGGIGTLDEISEVLVANQLKQINKPIAIFNPNGYYNPLFLQLDIMRQQGLLRPDSHIGLHIASSLKELLSWLQELRLT